MQDTVGKTMSRTKRCVALVAAVLAALFLLSACVPIRTPAIGKAVAVQAGESLVFGRIRVLNAKNESIEYSAFWPDPWDQPFFAPGPRMTLQLRQLFPPAGAYRYKLHPAPAVEKDGSFSWILPAGDYELLGNPRLYGSERFDDEETVALARFKVPASGGTSYLGTLVISVGFGLEDMVSAWRKDEAEYDIRGYRVVDEREQALAQLRARFPAIPEPVVTGLMRAE